MKKKKFIFPLLPGQKIWSLPKAVTITLPFDKKGPRFQNINIL
jgi:hypothetical protein